MNLDQLRQQFSNEQSCRQFFESVLWQGLTCHTIMREYSISLTRHKVVGALSKCRFLQIMEVLYEEIIKMQKRIIVEGGIREGWYYDSNCIQSLVWYAKRDQYQYLFLLFFKYCKQKNEMVAIKMELIINKFIRLMPHYSILYEQLFRPDHIRATHPSTAAPLPLYQKWQSIHVGGVSMMASTSRRESFSIPPYGIKYLNTARMFT